MPFLPPEDGHHHRPCKAHKLPPEVAPHHDHPEPGPGCCCSVVVQRVSSPTDAVWSVLRCFDRPQSYKRFVRSCALLHGRGGVGTVREVRLVSGLPASSSLERLEVLDEERRVLSFSVVGGEHRLRGYRSVTTLHAAADGGGTVVVESYVVDVPEGNTVEETTAFVDTIVRCNLQSLACVVEAAVALGRGHDEASAM